MSNFNKVTFQEFLWLLTRTQKNHIDSGEPIPAINKEGQEKIQYCLEAPFMGFGDIEFHKTFDEKAAILFYDICKLHCLLNGNKRMAVETTMFFIWKNARYSHLPKRVLIELAKKVVESNADNKDETVWWLKTVFRGGIRKMSTGMKIGIILKYTPELIGYLFITAFKKLFKIKSNS